MTLILFLFVLATALVIAEVLFPSFGLLSLLAAAAYLGAVITAFDVGRTQGWTAVIAVVLIVPGAIYAGIQILKHTPVGNRLLLSGPTHEEISRGRIDLRAFLGRHGIAATPLRPAGAVDFDDERVDAVSDGGWIPAGAAVTAVHVEGYRLVVAPAETVRDAHIG